jgi:hypothetical protein
MSGATLVVAGSSATSLLFQKVSEAMPPCGNRMPHTALAATPIALIGAWIDEGAPND